MSKSTTEELAPPRDSVWTKYSPHHEFPIAFTAAAALHGLIFVAILAAGLFLYARWHGEPSAPPKLDVAFVMADKADGLAPGGGSDPGTPGNQTEQVDPKEPPKVTNDISILSLPKLDQIPPTKAQPQIDVPTISDAPPNIQKVFEGIERNLTPTPEPTPRIVVPKGAGGGQGGGGVGPGKGPGVGPGPGGVGGIPGEAATRAEILAARWRFNPSGSPHEHVQKLIAAGVRVGFKDGNGFFWQIADLKKRPVALQREPFEKYKDTVKWFNQEPRSVIGLANELRLPAPPLQFVLLLPQDREQKLADAELKFAKDRNRDLSKVQETWFDFRSVGGSFEPVVTGQFPFEPRPKW